MEKKISTIFGENSRDSIMKENMSIYFNKEDVKCEDINNLRNAIYDTCCDISRLFYLIENSKDKDYSDLEYMIISKMFELYDKLIIND